ncbi:hypothetical protein JX265_011204 [Neoarthrinium moseri]|uniref:Rhodopsin domain-containing protein n=1 Tax=Neoarthrinium moseri TaxID=1658444 RepID=A0A9Q0AHR7_9PEZI|nr:uncharacterized protein JN550_010508 [Neoarthrinium moseri]KAI1845900.1 hypothetical protein JX266_007987 [Neoarthrinium moseri]KAI1857469.1 hypothetical protein JX265_011204 [Neoarthrinium moseri]KAI1862043.1 hypothetical protein JN550_010508 [Neoarthrinium moseri]
MAPPAGVTPNADKPYTASSLITIVGIFLPVATATMAIRIYTRAVISAKIAFDDLLMVAAMVLNIVMVALCLDMLNYGLGKDLWDVPLQPDLYPNWMVRNVIAAMVFCAATGLAKGSILLFYLRIFPSRSMKIATWAVFAFTLGYSFASVLVNAFSCKPISGSWVLETSLTAVCINRPAFYFAQAALGIATDIATVVVPLPALRTLQLRSRQKIGIAFVLTMGAFVCIVSIIRLQSLYALLTDADLTKNTVTALMWCILELNLSIIGGSIPALKPFAQRFFPRLLGSSGGSRGRSTSGAYPLPSRNTQYGPGSHFSKSQAKSRVEADDTGSEEYIMQGLGGAAITKTVQFGYEVEDHEKNSQVQTHVVRKSSTSVSSN